MLTITSQLFSLFEDAEWPSRWAFTHHARVVFPVVNGHVSPFASVVCVCEELAHKFLQGEPALLEDTCFPVLGENDVVGC